MNTGYPTRTAELLREYSVGVETWWSEAGDTDQVLGARELLADHDHALTAEQREALRRADDAAIALIHGLELTASGWDVEMLRKLGELIERERSSVPSPRTGS